MTIAEMRAEQNGLNNVYTAPDCGVNTESKNQNEILRARENQNYGHSHESTINRVMRPDMRSIDPRWCDFNKIPKDTVQNGTQQQTQPQTQESQSEGEASDEAQD